MKILIVFATYSSGTQTASGVIEKTLIEAGNEVKVQNARESDPKSFSVFDLIIFGSPSWYIDGKDGQPHEYFGSLLKKMNGMDLKYKQYAVFGLGHSSYYSHFCGAVDVLEEGIKKLGGKIIVDSLRIDGFYFYQNANEERIRKWTKDLFTENNKMTGILSKLQHHSKS